MTCSNCGATIADRAIVCYRCGTATAIPAAPERPARRAGAPVGAIVAGGCAIAAAAGWFLTPPGTPHTLLASAAAVACGAAIVLLGRRR